MKITNFDYKLPKELIQTRPKGNRGESRMMCLENNEIIHSNIKSFPDYLTDNDVLVFNQTKVNKARTYGLCKNKQVELLVDIQDNTHASCMLKTKCKPQVDDIIEIENFQAKIIRKRETFFDLELLDGSWHVLLDKHGILPLPPYFKREADTEDYDRYQTIFAKKQGSIAAPTASLHFTKEIIETILNKGVKIVYIDLEVGFGTFLPVKTENILEHTMHKENYTISKDAADFLNESKQMGKNIVAIGTTVVRALEHNYDKGFTNGTFAADNFIYPGYSYKIVGSILTNFHLPKSTLLMLISAFVGQNEVKKMYDEAIKQEYKFFSYGDCMFLKGKNEV